jgi:hypothetical protein
MDLPTLDDRLERRVAKVGRLNEAVRYLEKKSFKSIHFRQRGDKAFRISL